MIHKAPSKDASTRKLLSSSIYGETDEAQHHEPISQGLETGNDSWMVAYLDLMTLLLALFVIMGAMSHSKAGVNLDGKTSNIQQNETAGKPQTMDASIARQGHKRNPEEFMNRVIGSNSLGGVMDARIQPGQIRLQMDSTLLFEAGKAELKDGAVQALEKLASLFKNNARKIDVEGHSDNVPTQGPMSNWSLSAARAVSVVEKLIEMGVRSDKLHASAFGDTRPVASNATEEGRRKNRRVEFVVELGPELVRHRNIPREENSLR